MTRIVTTDDLTLVLKKAYSLYKVAEAAQRISADLDETKANIKISDESIDRGQKRLRNRKSHEEAAWQDRTDNRVPPGVIVLHGGRVRNEKSRNFQRR